MKKLFLLLFSVFLTTTALLSQRTVSGTVTDDSGTPLIGASVIVKENPTIGTLTDAEGRFSLKIDANSKNLSVSYVGFISKETALGTQSVYSVSLESDAKILEEVVVVGYGVQKKSEVTGSISQVKGDEIAQLAAPSFESLLSGRAAGVQINTTSGIIGDVPRINIRGVGSISSGTYPLIVVDGLPIVTGNTAFYDGVNSLGDINPSDIESIEILKDGSATAIYGSRAANGVMLITTKKGKEGKFKVNYNTYVGVAQPTKLFDLLNAEESILINNEKRTNRGQSVIAIAEGAAGPAVDEDWQKAVLRENAFQHDHVLSFSGANERTNYYVSLGFSDQDGVTRPNAFKRYTLRTNIEQKVKKWLTLGANIGLTQSEVFGLNSGENSLSGNIFSAIRQLPNTPIYNANHPTGYNIDLITPSLVGRYNNATTIGDNLPNIVYVIDNNVYQDKVLRTLASTYANINLLPSLVLRTQFSVDKLGTEGLLYWNPLHGDGQSVNGRVQNGFQNIFRWNWQNSLSYNETFADVHNFGFTVVQEFQKQRNNWFEAAATDLSNSFFQHNVITGSFGTPNLSGSLAENGFISYAGRLNYNYNGKYYLQASLRRDGISSMPAANKWGLFPGASVGWTISKEPFMKSLSFISDLKLRASYAQVGNTSVGNYPYAGLYGGAKYGDKNGLGFVQMGNDQLKWETSKKMDIGFDLMLAEGRYKFYFDYFVNNQDGLILSVPTPPTLGVPGNSYSANIGKLTNKGYEFSGEAIVFNKSDFSVTLDANLTLMSNVVDSLYLGRDITGTYTIIREGESINSIYGYDYIGVNKANGNPIYRKQNGTLVQGNIATSTYVLYNENEPGNVATASSLSSVTDKKVFGPSLPTYFGSFGIKVGYKAFDVSALFRYSGGNYIMNRTRDDLTQHSFTNNSTEILGRWQSVDNPGDGWTPRLWAQGGNFVNISNQSNGRFIEKGDYLKFSNLVIGFNMPKSLLSRIGISSLRIYAQGSELYMLTDYTGIDPEMENNGVDFNLTPRQRTLTLGLNISF
ncbi:MAG: SusC/RagA family TonB-linked outer membrane protein [Deltaproteobacteria bacterium]